MFQIKGHGSYIPSWFESGFSDILKVLESNWESNGPLTRPALMLEAIRRVEFEKKITSVNI